MKNKQSGQTLVALLFFVMIGIVATSASIAILFTNLSSEQKFEDAERVRQLSEMGIEKALVSILRDTEYSGETISIDGDSVVVSVSGTTLKVIESVATSGDVSRKIEVNASFSENILTTTSWNVIY